VKPVVHLELLAINGSLHQGKSSAAWQFELEHYLSSNQLWQAGEHRGPPVHLQSGVGFDLTAKG
jgi:hypothetical protein